MTFWAWYFLGTTIVFAVLAWLNLRGWRKSIDLCNEALDGWSESSDRARELLDALLARRS